MRIRSYSVIILIAAFTLGALIAYTVLLAYYHVPQLHVQVRMQKDISMEIYRLVEDVKRDLEIVRGLKFRDSVNIRVITSSWVVEHWGGPHKPTKDMLLREVVSKLTLLVSPSFNMCVEESRWASLIMAAVEDHTLYIVKDYINVSSPGVRRLLAHELTHILQNIYFPEVTHPGTLDGELALYALIEGDADFTADLYCNYTGIPPRIRMWIPLDAPYIALKVFPYVYGEDFVKYLYMEGGWDLVNAAYEKPPRSTEQVMHPEKYVCGEEPVAVKLSIEQHEKPLYSDTMGEYYILLVIATKLGLNKAQVAAQGWGGDRLALYYNHAIDMWSVYWNITWDSEQDAREFYQIFSDALMETGATLTLDLGSRRVFSIWNYVVDISILGKNTLLEARAHTPDIRISQRLVEEFIGEHGEHVPIPEISHYNAVLGVRARYLREDWTLMLTWILCIKGRKEIN